MHLCYARNFIISLSFMLLYGSNCESDDDKLCPNQMETEELRDEFTFIVHLIEKSYVGQENGWRKFAKFLTFLAPNKRAETVNAFCAKNSEESHRKGHRWFRKTKHSPKNNNDQCLNKIFWPSNAELAKLKNANVLASPSKYNEAAKMIEGMLMRREQLMAEILHKALTTKGKDKIDENFDILAEILLGRPKHELIDVIMEYNNKFNARNGGPSAHLLGDIRQKIDPKKRQKYDYEILVERINSMQQKSQTFDEQRLVNDIFKKCDDWKNWSTFCCARNDCTKCELPTTDVVKKRGSIWHGDEILTQMSTMNNLLRELLVFFDYNSELANDFATEFKPNCDELIKYMQKTSNSQSLPSQNSWFKSLFKNNKPNPSQKTAELRAQKENLSRNNFAQIWKLFEIAGLLEIGSEYLYLARRLNEANLTKNFEAVSRIIGIHVGTDMLKILTNLKNLPNDAPAHRSKFSGMFQVAYTEILRDTQEHCYQYVEPKKAPNRAKNEMEMNVQPVQHAATNSRSIKVEKPKKEILEFGFEYLSQKINNSPKNRPSYNKQKQILSPNSSEEDIFYSPENFEIDDSTETSANKILDQNHKFSEFQNSNPKILEITEENSSEIEQQFHSAPQVVANRAQNNEREIENGINYLKLFNEFTSLFLSEQNDKKMEYDWKHLKVPIKIVDNFLLFFTENVEENILKRKWKMFGHKKWCKPIENESFTNLLERKNYINKQILIVQQRWKDIMPKINLNFFKVLLLFGLNLADHRQSKMSEENRAEKKAKKKMLKMKVLLSNAIQCFPPLELDLNDNFDVHVTFGYVMTRILIVTAIDKENMEEVIHIFQLVERNGQLNVESNEGT